MVVKNKLLKKTIKNFLINNLNNFDGIINFIDKKHNETGRFWIQYELEKYLSNRDCEKCIGYRLNERIFSSKN